MKHLLSSIFIFILFYSCNQSNKNGISQEEYKQLLEQELQNQNRAIKGAKEVKITVVTDIETIEKLRTAANQKKVKLELEKQLEKQKASLADRYKNGDKSVIQKITHILESNNLKEKKELYRILSTQYDAPENYSISEKELRMCILNNIAKKDDEEDVVQLAGIMKFPEYPKVFEERLLSNKSGDIDRLIYWLGNDGSSEATVDYAEKLIFSNSFDFDKYKYVLSGLENFYENGNYTIKKKVFNIFLDIYNKGLISKEKYLELKTTWSSSNPAINVTNILLKYGDQRVIPIARDFIKMEINESSALIFLIKQNDKNTEQFVFKFLENENTFFDGLEPAVEQYKMNKNDKIIEKILSETDKQKKLGLYQTSKIVSALEDMNADHYINNLEDFINDEELIKSIKESFTLSKLTIDEFAQDFYDLGAVASPYPKNEIDSIKKNSKYSDNASLRYEFLEYSGNYTIFDAETGYVPVDYDTLIIEIAKLSNGVLSNIEVYMDTQMDEDYNVNYILHVFANNRVYISSPEDIGDWYDVNHVVGLLNKILEDKGIKERYVQLVSGDQMAQILFGIPSGIEALSHKYKL